MSRPYIKTVGQISVTPKDEKTCQHSDSWHTYVVNGRVVTKKLCFYCKRVEAVQ